MRTALPYSIALLALALAPAPAWAQAPAPATLTMELELVLGAGAESCPGEEMLRRELARRVGYDPFAKEATGAPAGRVRTTIARRGRGLTATCDYVDARGIHQWTRTYAVEGTTTQACEEALKDVAVDLQVELPLFRKPLPPIPPPPPAPPPEPARPPLVAPDPVPARAWRRPRLELGVAAFVATGIAPAATLGGAVHVGVGVFPFGRDRPWLSFAVEGRADAPAASGPGGLQTRLLAGSAMACGHEDLFTGPAGVTWAVLGCVIGTAGKVHGWSQGVNRSVSLGGTYAGLGPRFGIEARLTSIAAVRLQGDVLPTVLAARMLVESHGEMWRTADVSGSAGLAFLLFF